MDGGRLFEEVGKLRPQPELLTRMGQRARAFAHPDAARRAADVVESTLHVDIEPESRNNTY